ncbi:YceI family protein [Sphingomonas sp.]|uniref:YceI family protein n=1 Tax=Sphingomonas sp. TaxID=28214 RepID=UPI003AFFF224
MRLALLTAAVLAAPLLAQPAPPPGGPGMMIHGDTGKPVVAGNYRVEPNHTQVAFAVSHLGISPYAGWFSDASGSLSIDPAHPEMAKLTVTVPIASVATTSPKLTAELKSADWFDAARFPTATFTSSAVHARGQGAAIEGNLRLHGVTRPVVIYARLFGSGVNPMSKAQSVGFVARTSIRRSEFGVTKYVPMVSDEVELVINAAFEK